MSVKVIPQYNYSGLMEDYLNQDFTLNSIEQMEKDTDSPAFIRVKNEHIKQIDTMNTIVSTLDRKDLTLKDKQEINNIVKNANVGCENYVPLFAFVNRKQRKELEKKIFAERDVKYFEYIFPILDEYYYNHQLIIKDFKMCRLYDTSTFWKINKKQ